MQPARPVDPARSVAIALVVASVLILIGILSKSWITAGAGSREIHFGPMGAEMCFRSMCVDVPGGKAKLPGDVELIQIVALIGGLAAAAAAGLFGGMVLANKKDKLPAPKLANMAFGIASFGMIYFEIRVLSEGHHAGLGWAPFPGVIGVVLAGAMLRKLIPHLPPKLPAAQAAYPGAQAPGQMPGQASQPMYPQGGQASQPMYPQGGQASQPMHPQGGQMPGQASQPMHPQGGQMPGQASGAMPGGQPAACPRCGTPLHFVAQYQRWFCPREQQYV